MPNMLQACRPKLVCILNEKMKNKNGFVGQFEKGRGDHEMGFSPVGRDSTGGGKRLRIEGNWGKIID